MASSSKEEAFSSFAGQFSFKVAFAERDEYRAGHFGRRAKNSTLWQYSEMLNKLFARSDEFVEVVCSFNVPDQQAGLHIRAKVMFSGIEFRNVPVVRCPKHKAKDDYIGILIPAIKATHEIIDGHDTVIWPLDATSTELRVNFIFSCLFSCETMKYRPLKLVFTLETDKGDVIGQQCFNLMTCIEPGQTSKKDEEALIKKNREPERLITLIINVGNSQNPKDIAETLVLSKNASDAAAPGLAATNDEHGIYQTMEGPNIKIKFNDRKLIVENVGHKRSLFLVGLMKAIPGMEFESESTTV